jgi:hypothetical protein
MATEDSNYIDLKKQLLENETENLRQENQNLRLKLLAMEHRHIDIDFAAIIRWVEDHYLFCIVALLALSYLGSFLIEAQETRRKFNGGR